MMSQDTPTAPLSLPDWQDELQQLAARAEAMGPDAELQDRLAVASDWFRLLWLSCDPAWIARSCRLASRLCEPVMAMPAGVDEQVLASWEARRAALKSVGQLKELGPGPVAKPELIGKRPGRPPRPKPELVPELESGAVVVATQAGIRDRVRAKPIERQPLRPRAERMAARPAPPAPEPPAAPEQAPVPAGWEGEPAPASMPAPEPVQAAPAPEPEQPRLQPGWGGEMVPAPAAAPAAPAPQRQRLRPVPAGVVPDGWISVEGLADRLHLTRGAVQRWAREGLLPESQMVHWRGRWWFDPEVEPPKPQPRKPRPAPDGWMHGAAVCSLLGIDRAQLARWRRDGVIPAGTYQPHGRGYVFDGDVVEAMLKRLQPASPEPTAGDGDGWDE